MSGYDFDMVKDQYNLRDEVEKVLGNPKRRNAQYDQYECPINAESTPDGAFTVYENGSYFCYSCESHGDVLDWFKFIKGKSLTELMQDMNIDLTPDELVRRSAENVAMKLAVKKKADAEYKTALDELRSARAWQRYHNNLTNHTRDIWRYRGVPDVWQDIWELGFRENFKYRSSAGIVTSDTITMPIKSSEGEVLTVRHRILSPIDGQKYRPDKAGLGAFPFLANTDMEKADNLIIVEGEIKGMVTFITYDDPNYQVVGVPSKSMIKKVLIGARGRNVVFVPDPDMMELKKEYRSVKERERAEKALAETWDAIKTAEAKVFIPPQKIDDWFLDKKVSTADMRGLFKQSRRYGNANV